MSIRTAKMKQYDLVVYIDQGEERIGEWWCVDDTQSHSAKILPLDSATRFRVIPLSSIVATLDSEASEAFRLIHNGGNKNV